MGGGLVATVEFCGISPWEVEVAHECLGAVFELDEIEAGMPEGGAAGRLRIGLPVAFGDEFFAWFGLKRWERLKSLLGEMKRRRGGRAGSLEVRIDFAGEPQVSFVVDSADRSLFVNSLEKIDYVPETMPHHLAGRPAGGCLVYRFGALTRRWAPEEAPGGRKAPDAPPGSP